MIPRFATKACREGCDLPKTDAKSDMHDTLILTTLMASPQAKIAWLNHGMNT